MCLGCRLTALLRQAPSLKYQCCSGGNSSRTAIRKKQNQNILLQKDRVLLQTCVGLHLPHHVHKHNHKACTGQLCIILCPISLFIKAICAPSNFKSAGAICAYRNKMCISPKERDEDIQYVSHFIVH